MVLTDNNLAPTDDLESAIVTTLDPGAYTVIVRGVADTTGVGLVEAYDIDTSTDRFQARQHQHPWLCRNG